MLLPRLTSFLSCATTTASIWSSPHPCNVVRVSHYSDSFVSRIQIGRCLRRCDVTITKALATLDFESQPLQAHTNVSTCCKLSCCVCVAIVERYAAVFGASSVGCGGLVGWLVGRLIGWLVGWLVGSHQQRLNACRCGVVFFLLRRGGG